MHCSASLALLPVALVACAAAGTETPHSITTAVEVSEDPQIASSLRASLDAFLVELVSGELSDTWVDAEDRRRDDFYFRSVLRAAEGNAARITKSYSLDGSTYFVTVAFLRERDGVADLAALVEFEATPLDGGYRFGSPFASRAHTLRSDRIGSVTFRHSGAFDRARAEEFVQRRAELVRLVDAAEEPLEYDCFASLDELLKTYGLVHDAHKCNFLGHDLGFLDDGGRRYVTGTANECYLFGYVRDLIELHADDPDELYWPYVNGVAAYYGGYGLSGDSMETLEQQFRAELECRPSLDFLAEFHKGRGSSIERHFSHYVMCAFLYREVTRRHGPKVAIDLASSGPNGERFFARLHELLGVDESGFHRLICSLIDAGGAGE